MIDEQLGTPAERQWCDGEFYPSIEWQSERADKVLPLCLPPLPDGSCQVCPAAEVMEDVELRLHPYLAETRPQCQLEHWEFGCMRTIESAITIDREPDYCCFEVAMWGDGCADQP